MKPARIEFDVGSTRFHQKVRLVSERGSDGVISWTIYRDAGNQRDDQVFIGGIDSATIGRMAEAVALFKS